MKLLNKTFRHEFYNTVVKCSIFGGGGGRPSCRMRYLIFDKLHVSSSANSQRDLDNTQLCQCFSLQKQNYKYNVSLYFFVVKDLKKGVGATHFSASRWLVIELKCSKLLYTNKNKRAVNNRDVGNLYPQSKWAAIDRGLRSICIRKQRVFGVFQ